MAGYCTYLDNALVSHATGKAAFTMPTPYLALIRATAGQSPRSTAVTVGQTTVPATPAGRMYRCTTAGTTGAGEPTWGTASGGTTADGTAVWTEMTPDFQANNANVTGNEASCTGYARAAIAAGAWGTASAGSITNSAGAITFAIVTAGMQAIGGWIAYDALTSGNPLFWGACALVIGTNVTPTVATSQLTVTQA